MKAFVTGGTGFLGTHLIGELSHKGWEITVLRREQSDISRIKDLPGVEFVYGDILDLESLKKAMPEKVDAVFHAAGSVAILPAHLEHTRFAINEDGTKNVVEVCIDKDIGRLIYTSTVAIFDWEKGDFIDENYPKNEWSDDEYVRSKKLADDAVDLGVKRGLDVVYMHPSAVFGRHDRDGWASAFKEIKKGLPLNMASPGGGSVCNARTVMAAHLSAYYNGTRGGRYILGGPSHTWFEVMNKITVLLNKPKLRAPFPTPIFNVVCMSERFISRLMKKEPLLSKHVQDIVGAYIYSDSSKAIKELGYDVSTLDEMLSDTYESLKEEGLI